MSGTARSTDGVTRGRIMSAMLTSGPVTASQLADIIGISPAGVRRHIDKLLEEGLVEHSSQPPRSAGQAGRGRPAQHYQLTSSGRDSFGSGYDELALEAFAAIEEIGGREAVKKLARKRAEKLLGTLRNRPLGDIADVANDVADTMAAQGYAAEANHVGSGMQLCQHHCPVHAVAAEYPEICEAEHELISELVGSAVAPLALIANGDGVCTAHISMIESSTFAGGTTMERSGGRD